jgi:hypothetical protein
MAAVDEATRTCRQPNRLTVWATGKRVPSSTSAA